MGYEIHITRNDDWWEEGVGGSISLDEWIAYINSDPSLRLDGFAEAQTPDGIIRYENEGLAVWIQYSGHDKDGNRAWFDFRDGCITVKNPDAEIRRQMYVIASELEAQVLGDEGEAYDSNGRIVDNSNPHSPQ